LETLREMARRHLKESEDRIVQQEALIEELDRDGRHGVLLSQACELLAAMQEHRKLVKWHLWEIEETTRFTKVVAEESS
jgi:hypothetical protein